MFPPLKISYQKGTKIKTKPSATSPNRHRFQSEKYQTAMLLFGTFFIQQQEKNNRQAKK